MKKILLFLLGLLLLLGLALYFGRNFIAKEVLTRKLSSANGAPVSIGSVDLSFRDNYILVKDITINSNIEKDKAFIKMDELKSFYKIDGYKRKVILNDTEIDGFLLFNERIDKALKNKETKDETETKIKNIKLFEEELLSSEKKHKKEEVVETLKDIYMGKVGLDNSEIDSRLKERYAKFRELEGDVKKLNSLAVDELKKSVKNIKEAEKKDIFSTIFSEIKNIEKNTKKILEDTDAIRLKRRIEEFIKDSEFKETLDLIVKEFLVNNNFIIDELDSYINIYLNSVYEEKIYNIFLKYNKLVEELEVRKKTDTQIKDNKIWELYFNSISINSNMYGINFYGEINNLSSRISKNKENIPFKLFGEKGETIGKIGGFFNLDTNILETTINIPEANLKDIDDKIFKNGRSTLYQNLKIVPNELSIEGNFYLKNMELNPEKIISEINTGEILVDELLTSVLSELKSGRINYEYSSYKRNLKIKSDISTVFEKVINDNDSFLKKNIKEKIKKEYLDTILD